MSIAITISSLTTGLRKPKNYDWKDSNLELFGSDVERKVKSKTILLGRIKYNLTDVK